MNHWPSVKSGNLAETNLFDMVKDQRNKHQYVSKALANYSAFNKIILTKHYNDTKTFKYLLEIHKDRTIRNTENSALNKVERDHLINAIKTRYKEYIRRYKLPLNSGKEKKI